MLSFSLLYMLVVFALGALSIIYDDYSYSEACFCFILFAGSHALNAWSILEDALGLQAMICLAGTDSFCVQSYGEEK